MWSPHDKYDKFDGDAPLQVLETLYYFDEPLIFVARFGIFKAIFSKIDEQGDWSLYAAGTVSDRAIQALKDGRLSVLGALMMEPCFVVAARNLAVSRYWQCPARDLPFKMLPKSGVALLASAPAVPDRMLEETAYLSVRFSGEKLARRSMAFSAFKGLVDGFYEAARKMLAPPKLQYAKSATFDFDIFEPAFGSLVIEIEKPKIDIKNAKRHLKDSNLTDESVRAIFDNQKDMFLEDMSLLVSSATSRDLTDKEAGDNFDVLNTIKGIVPSDETIFSNVELSSGSGSNYFYVNINEKTGERLRKAYVSAATRHRDIVGHITIVNSKQNTFVIDTGVREITCFLDSERFELLEKDARFRGGTRVAVSGGFTSRSVRDMLTIEDIQLL